MAQPTALAFYIACIAAKGAKAASFSVSPLKTGHRIGTNQHAERGSLRGDPALNVRFGQKRTSDPADQLLALDPSRGHQLPPIGRYRQITLADRARLSGAQTGSWAWALRGARMAWLSSPRYAVHRSLRIPDLRAGDGSPLRTSFHRAVRGGSFTQRLSTQGSRRCGLNVTSRTRSQPCADNWPSRSPGHSGLRDELLKEGHDLLAEAGLAQRRNTKSGGPKSEPITSLRRLFDPSSVSA